MIVLHRAVIFNSGEEGSLFSTVRSNYDVFWLLRKFRGYDFQDHAGEVFGYYNEQYLEIMKGEFGEAANSILDIIVQREPL